MTIAKRDGRQWPLSAFFRFDHTMLTSGSAVNAVQLPDNAMVIGGEVVVETAWNSATSDVLDIGDSGDDDRYTSTPIDLQSTGRTALDLTGYLTTAIQEMLATWTGVGAAPSAGSALLHVQYVVLHRNQMSQGDGLD